MTRELPAWLAAKLPAYERLEQDVSEINSSQFGISICQYLSAAGLLMAIGVTFFHSASPFYAGMGMTLLVICGGRWWWLRTQLDMLYRKQAEIDSQFRAAGFKPPWRGVVEPLEG